MALAAGLNSEIVTNLTSPDTVLPGGCWRGSAGGMVVAGVRKESSGPPVTRQLGTPGPGAKFWRKMRR